MHLYKGGKIVLKRILSGLIAVSMMFEANGIATLADTVDENINTVIDKNNGEKVLDDVLTEGDWKYRVSTDGIEIAGYTGSADAIIIPDTIDGQNVTSIGNLAFRGCNSLGEITIPVGIVKIGTYVFTECSNLNVIEVASENPAYKTFDGCLYDKDLTEIICCPANKSAINFAENVEKIGSAAFYECKKLQNIYLPDSVKSIGIEAFRKCSDLVSIKLPVRLASIGYSAFGECDSLNEMEIPENVEKMDDGVFYNCGNLKIVKCFARLVVMGNSIFEKCSQLTIYGYKDSTIEKYAEQHGIVFEQFAEQIPEEPNESDEFNMNIYRANFLVDDNYPATKGLNYDMIGKTPSEIFISAAQENGLQYAVMAWEAVTATLDAVDSPSSLIDFTMEEKDLYSAVIFDLLQVSVESDIASSCQDAIKDAKKVSSKVKSWMQESFNLDVAKKENFNTMTYEQKQSLISKTEKDFKKQYDKDLNSINEVLSNISNVLEAADCIETYMENVATMCELAKISDSMKIVLNEMYNNCPESKKALKSALRDCVSIINASSDQFIGKIITCTGMYVGQQAVKFGIDELWDGIKKQINFSNPTLFILTECYKVDKYIVNELFNTDAISEQYMNMLAVTDVKDLIIKVLQFSKSKYKNNPLEDNAKAYLSAIDFFYAGLDYNCKSAYKFVDAVDDALISQIAALLGGNNNEEVKKSIKSIQQTYYSNYAISILSSWINELDVDYPNSGLYEKYESLLDENYKKAVTKKYGVACPVDVYVYDKNNQLVAYVIDNKPYSAGDITVVVEGTSKELYFYDSDQYHIEYVGTGVGDMEASIEEYDQAGNIMRQVDYCKIPLSDGLTYETEIKEDGAITLLKDNEGKIITADLDTNVLPGNNRKVQIENGILLSADGPVFSAEIPFNNEVSVYAYIPEGYTFEHWIIDSGEDLFEDSYSQVTTFKMPDNDIKISAVLTKKQVKVEKVTLSLLSQGIESGKTLQLTATVEPPNADNVNLNWISDNTAVATVNQQGLVTAVGIGQATITAESQDGSGIGASCVVTVTKSSEDEDKPEDDDKPGDDNKPSNDNKPDDDDKLGDDNKPGDGNKPGSNKPGGSSGGNKPGGSSSGGNIPGDSLSGNNQNGNNGNNGNSSGDDQKESPVKIQLLYYIVEFNANGGTKLSRKTMTLLNDDNLGILPKVQFKNYSFNGWYTQKSGGIKVDSSTILNAGTTLFAQWTKIDKPSQVKALSLKSKQVRQLAVSFQKIAGAKGYEIACSTNKKFPSSSTKKTISNSPNITLKKLKSGKKYYVRVRAYKEDSTSKKIYGVYSKAMSIKVK